MEALVDTVEIGSDLVCAGDVGELYGSLAGRLEQIVRQDVRGAESVVEDACQFAWWRLVQHADRVRLETVLAWLARTAVHEAFRLVRRDRRELSLETEHQILDVHGSGSSPPPEVVCEQRERLRVLDVLPERQRRMVWLHALGLSYEEIALYVGCTERTVERQLLRGKRRLRSLDGEVVAQ